MFERGTTTITNVTSRAELYDALVDLNLGFVKNTENERVYWKNSSLYLSDTSSTTNIGWADDVAGNLGIIVGDVPASGGISASAVYRVAYILFGDSICLDIRSSGSAVFRNAVISPKTENDNWLCIGQPVGGGNPNNKIFETNMGLSASGYGNISIANNYSIAAYPTDSLCLSKFYNGQRWLDNIYIVSSRPRFGQFSVQKYASGDKTFLICNLYSNDAIVCFGFDITNDLATT